MRLHYLQHVPFEGLAAIEEWASERRHSITRTRLYADEELPSSPAFDLLVILGGPMSVHDEHTHPWLVREKEFIGRAIADGKTIVGICLGAQLIADVLGAEVRPCPRKEIGWFPIWRSDAASSTPLFDCVGDGLTVFHWHGEMFEIPAGAVPLARSEACENQAFLYGERVLALQFHLETTRRALEELIRNCSADLNGGPFVQQPEQMLSEHGHFSTIRPVLFQLMDQLAKTAATA